MINFRFHIVSLIAVFLALAVGVVMGSTVVDRAIVDGLRSQIDRVRSRANDARAENARLRSQLDHANTYADESALFAVADRLLGATVGVVAERGIDEAAVKSQMDLLRRSGAKAPGVLWLEPPWALGGNADNAARLAQALRTSTHGDRALREEALVALARRLGGAGVSAGNPDVLDALAQAGFVSYDTLGQEGADSTVVSFPGPAARLLVIGGTDAKMPRDGLHTFVRDLVDQGVPTAVGEVFHERSDGPARGDQLAQVRSDRDLASRVSTIDDLDLVEGRVGAVLVLADLGRGAPGSYGYGDGARRALPEWAPR